MKILSIGTNELIKELETKFQENVDAFSELKINLVKILKGNIQYIDFETCEGELSFRNYEKVKNYVKDSSMETIAWYIKQYIEPKLINKIINKYYSEMNDREKEVFYSKIILSSKLDEYSAQKNYIDFRLNEYFNSFHEINIEGFVKFRLKIYYNYLVNFVISYINNEIDCKEKK